jgi:AcrR family transcriptional regulator
MGFSVSSDKTVMADAGNRILEAAGEIFAEEGFGRATIRKICTRAGVNVALVSYHFGDKEGLYLAVMKHFRAKALEEYPPDLGIDESSPAEERLKAFVRSFMFRILSQGQASWFGKLFAREFIEPTKAFGIMVEESILPSYNMLIKTVSEIMGAHADEHICRLCVASIVGQCLYYRNSRAVIDRITGKDSSSTDEIEGIAEHITRFSLEAMKACYGYGGKRENRNSYGSKRSVKFRDHQRTGEVNGRKRTG